MLKRFLGFNPLQYGDLFMGTVAARCLKAAEPDSHLTYVVGGDFRECAPLLMDHPHIDRVHVLSGGRGFDQADRIWIARQGFTHVFDPNQDHDHANPWWRHRKQSLESASMHGVPIAPGETGKIDLTRWFSLREDLADTVALAPFPAFYAGIHNDKAFPLELAQQIVWYLRQRGFNVLQVGGPDEPQLQNTIRLPALSYFESARATLSCRAFIGGDSGFAWLLSGYNARVLALYGHRYYGLAHVSNIQPLNPNAIYLSSDKMTDFTIDQIQPSIETLLS